MTDLTPPGGDLSIAVAINESGQVAGRFTRPPNSNDQAFLYSGGVTTGLGTLPGGVQSQASAINDAGQVVGDSITLVNGNYQDHVFLYGGGLITDLGTLPGGDES